MDKSQASKGKLDYVKVFPLPAFAPWLPHVTSHKILLNHTCASLEYEQPNQLVLQYTFHMTGLSCSEVTVHQLPCVCTAQVKNWGSGEPADLGELQVESFSQDLFSDHSKPFYEQLARRLEELQVHECLHVLELLTLQLHAAWFASSIPSITKLVHWQLR